MTQNQSADQLVTQLHDTCLACDPKTVANPKVRILKRAQLVQFLENALRETAAAAGQSAAAVTSLRDCAEKVRRLEGELQAAESRAMKAEQEAIGALSELEKLRAENEQLRAERNQYQIDATTLRNQLRIVEGELATLDALKVKIADQEKTLRHKELSLEDAHRVLVEKGLQDVDLWVKKNEKQRMAIDEYELSEDFFHAFSMPDTQYLHRLLNDAENRAESLKKAIGGLPHGVTQSATGPAMAMIAAHLDIGVRARRGIADYERSVIDMDAGKGSLDRVVNLAVAIAQVQMFIELARMLNFGLQMAMLGLKSGRA